MILVVRPMLVLLLVLAALAAAFPSNATIPFAYPLYKQCDSRWGNHVIVTKTICQVGCLMSSVSMALGGHNITIDGRESNPSTLNAWLRANGGYDGGNDLEEEVVPKINPGHVAWKGRPNHKLVPDEVKRLLDSRSTIVIANVMNGGHFVLVVGYDQGQTNFYVNDPGFNREYYPFDQVVGWRIFIMTTVTLE